MTFNIFCIELKKKNVFTFSFSYYLDLNLVSVLEIVKGPCQSRN